MLNGELGIYLTLSNGNSVEIKLKKAVSRKDFRRIVALLHLAEDSFVYDAVPETEGVAAVFAASKVIAGGSMEEAIADCEAGRVLTTEGAMLDLRTQAERVSANRKATVAS